MNELNQLFAERDYNPMCCAICKVPLATDDDMLADNNDASITDNDEWQGDSHVEVSVEIVSTPSDEHKFEPKRHYVDPSLVTKGLDERVIELMDTSQDPAKPYKCNLCGTSCAKIYNFLRHLKIKHELDFLQKRPYSCDLCGEGFTCFTNLHLHMTSHNAEGNEQFTCEYCGANLKTMYSYRRHVKIIHKSERTLPCQYCGKLFRDISEVTGHEKLHQEVKAYPCDLCEMSFTLPSRLKRHRMTHTGERPYRCQLCGSSVRDKDYLAKHMRVYHSGTHKYSCKKCSFTCAFRKDLTIHNNVVHGTRAGRQVTVGRNKSRRYLLPGTQHSTDEKIASVEEVACVEEIATSESHTTEPPSELPPETLQVISTLLEEADQSKLTGEDAPAQVEYHCVDCGFKTSDGLAMKSHMNSHLQEDVLLQDVEENDAVSYRCEDCGFTSANAAELYEHVLTDHQEEMQQNKTEKEANLAESLQCDKCNEAFSDLTGLRIHQASHISVRTAPGAPQVTLPALDSKTITSPITIHASTAQSQPNSASRFSELVDAADACEPVKITESEKKTKSTGGIKPAPVNKPKKAKHSDTAQVFNIGNEEIVGKVTPAHIKRYVEARHSQVPTDEAKQDRKRAASESNGEVDEARPSKAERTATRSVTRNKAAAAEADYKRMTYM